VAVLTLLNVTPAGSFKLPALPVPGNPSGSVVLVVSMDGHSCETMS
jgi:hypothetical protein